MIRTGWENIIYMIIASLENFNTQEVLELEERHQESRAILDIAFWWLLRADLSVVHNHFDQALCPSVNWESFNFQTKHFLTQDSCDFQSIFALSAVERLINLITKTIRRHNRYFAPEWMYLGRYDPFLSAAIVLEFWRTVLQDRILLAKPLLLMLFLVFSIMN